MRNQRGSLLNLSLAFQVLILFIACTSKNIKGISGNNNDPVDPDYSHLDHWAAHPWKTDPADNIPLSLIDKTKDTIADVFFIHPTTYTDPSMPMGWNADINNTSLNNKTDNASILYQASVFNRYCRIFAPRYRQANLKAFYTTDKKTADSAFEIAYMDIKRAFQYYLIKYNNDRPVIIASHSQGTLHAGRLLKEFFEEKPLQKKLVAAYLIGLPVYTNYFPELKPCTDSTAIGCFVTWRTFKENYVADYIKAEKERAYVINPLKWNLDTTLALASFNKGGILRDFNKVIPSLVHAQIHGNVLWVNKPKFFGDIFLTMKNYHIADYNLFYINIRENVGTRIRKYFEEN